MVFIALFKIVLLGRSIVLEGFFFSLLFGEVFLSGSHCSSAIFGKFFGDHHFL